MSEEKLTRAAVVTGGSRGIGRAVCVALAKQGCNVVVNYCHGEAAAAETAALCKELGVETVTVQADVSTAEGCKKLFEEAVNAFGRVDILVNNAGVTRDNLILRLSEEDFDTFSIWSKNHIRCINYAICFYRLPLLERIPVF